MNRERAVQVANALLYEGYMLYPYRPSAIKNRQRWTFGILYPPSYPEVCSGTERSGMHSECLLKLCGQAELQIQLRFLQLIARQVAREAEGRLESLSSLVIDDRLIESWDEGIERSVDFELPLDGPRKSFHFSFPGKCESESLRDRTGHIVGTLNHQSYELSGTVSVCFSTIRNETLKIAIDVSNVTSLPLEARDRNSALLRSLLSAHIILTIKDGEFISLLDPPEDMREAVNGCKNTGNFPVLVGTEGERDMLLCSPIILYDYPQVAPESTGDFYDATEMDEMLTLRVMTLTDQEKEQMGLGDERVRKLLQRTQESAQEQLLRTHGTIRSRRRIDEEP